MDSGPILSKTGLARRYSAGSHLQPRQPAQKYGEMFHWIAPSGTDTISAGAWFVGIGWLCGKRFVVPSKTKPLTDLEITVYESKRDLAAELLESVRQMKAGKTQVVYSAAVEARERTGLSQSQFAALLGVSVRTLQGWEQGRKEPSGAARTLLNIARTNPKALLAVAGK